MSHHEISESTGVNGIILSTLTSSVANIPLVRGMISLSVLKNQVCAALGAVALAGLVGVDVNELLQTYAPGIFHLD